MPSSESDRSLQAQRFNIPYTRNSYFTGREALLSQIHETLGQTGAVAVNQARAVSGLGGVGKTQTAIEYAYRYFHDQPFYEWVFWVNASELTLASSFGAIATALALPSHQTNKLDENIAAVQRWLETHDRWLLIFDNADEPKSLKPFRPKNPNGRLLITSRAPRFDELGVANPIELREMTPPEAEEFLLKRTKRSRDDQEEAQAAAELAKDLGYLPLALEQAGAYIATKGVRFAAYLRSYRQRRLELLKRQQPLVGDYPESVATTWSINFEAVKVSNPAAADLLNLSAFLAPDNIPYELLRIGREHLSELLNTALADALEDELLLPELLAELTRYSLIRLETVDRYSIHRIVQEVLRDALSEEARQQWRERMVAALNEAFPSPEFENWERCDRLVEHVLAIELETSALASLSLARLLHQAASYLHTQGRYTEAEPLYLRALDIKEQQLGASHPAVATSLGNLANLYDSQGRYTEAEPLHLRALDIDEQQLGASHPDVATSLNNLAYLYQSQGRYTEAEPLLLRALDIDEQQLGASHPDVATSLGNLANLYKSQGRYPKAEPLYLRALDIKEQQLGASHPAVATSLGNLANLYDSQGRYTEAEPLYLRSLLILFNCLGEAHPNTQTAWNNFVVCLWEAIAAGQAAQLSDHPTTQAILAQLQAGSETEGNPEG